MKVEYDFYDANRRRCEANILHIFDAPIGSVACQGCEHFIDFERNKWVDCAINAGMKEPNIQSKDHDE